MRRLLVLAAGALLATGPAAGAATIAVDTTSDAMAADGHCSLREAITAANTDNFPEPGPNECPRGDGADTITLGPGSFEFALSGADDDFNNTGDLDIAGPTTITGAGALLTTIDAKQLDRVFDILSGASLSLSGVTVTGGRAPDGLNGATAGASGFAGEDGGGIHNQGAVTLTDCVVTGNRTGNGGAGASATGSGGGLGTSGGAGGFAQGGAGGAGGAGGGLWNNGSMTLTRVVVSSNATGDGGNGGVSKGGAGGASATTGAGGDGGTGRGGPGGRPGQGGAVSAAGNTTLLHATLTGNLTGLRGSGGAGTAGDAGSNGGNPGGAIDGADGLPGDGGAIFVYMGMKVTLTNSLASLNGGPACSGTVDDGRYNIFNGEGACPGARTDPKLGPLADNGGLTQTRAPLPGSPAIDLEPASGAGCSATDQRGAARPGGSACDAGAYEVAPPAVQVTAAGATTSGTVNPNARATTYHFDYGTTNAYGSSTAEGSLPAGVDAVAVSAALDGLAPGTTYHVRLIATNADGTNASADATFTTTAQGGGAAKDTTAPIILSASVKPKTFRRRRGTTFRYKLSEPAKVVFTIQRRKGKRYVKATRFSKASKAGANIRKFRTRKLRPGRYRATLVATDAAGNRSKARRVTFRVKR
jgi:CSLREA domain-containing protein